MQYLVDAYNMLFLLGEGNAHIEKQRNELIETLATTLSELNIRASLIFDSGTTHQGDFPQSYKHQGIEIVFSPHGMCADRYIVELAEQIKNPKGATLVSNDRDLQRSCKYHHLNIMSCESFLELVERKQKKHHIHTKEERRDPSYEEYLREQFEKKLD